MKKVFSLILVIALMVVLCGCKSKDKNTDPSESAVSGSTATDGVSENTASTQGSTKETTFDSTEETETDSTNATTSKPTEKTDNEPTEGSASKPTEAPVTKPTPCNHSYKDATCTTPKTCTKCSATEGNALGHTWNNATCTSPKTCSRCNTTEGTAAGHSWKNATCTAPKTCSKCSATEGSVSAHNFVNGSCTVCKATDSVNPKTHLKIYNDCFEEYISQAYAPYTDNVIFAPGLSFYDDGGYGEGIYCLLLEAMFSSDPEDLDEHNLSRPPVTYNGVKHYRVGAGMSPAEVDLTDSQIIVTTPAGSTFKLIIMSNGNLKVIESSVNNYPVGLVLSTSWSYLK